MAIKKITYSNKVALNENQDVADINKVNATDLNEIKDVVNTNSDNIGDLSQMNIGTNLVGTLNTISSYSTTEQVIGTWIDGKPVYRIVKNIGSLPNNGRITSSFAGIIPLTASVTRIYGISERKTGTSPNFTYDYLSLNDVCSLLMYRASSQTLFLDTNQDRSTYTGIVIIEYTKTTD